MKRIRVKIGFVLMLGVIVWSVITQFQAKKIIEIANENKEKYQRHQNDLQLILEVNAELSAYTSDPAETDDTPEITAANTKVRPGIVANNCYEFGTRVVIQGVQYEVWDRMNSRYGCNHFDIWHEDKKEALEFGRRKIKVIVVTNENQSR